LMKYLQVQQHLAIIYPESQYPFFFRHEVQKVTFLNKPMGKWGRVPMAYRYWRLLHDFQPDIIHAHQWDAMDFARVFHRLWKGQKVLAQTQNNVLQEGRLERERRYFRFADCIATVSQESFDQYRTLIPEAADKLVMIPNGVDLDIFSPGNRLESRQKLGIPANTLLALLPGRLTPQKNQLGLIQAVSHLIEAERWPPNAQILCLGESHDERYTAQVMEIARPYLSAVRFQPAVSNLAAYYHACDFLLLPSLYEGLPLTLLEAAACARPALVSDTANTARMIVEGETGWVVPANDQPTLAEGLLRAFNTDPEVRGKMGQAAYQYVTAHHDMKRIAAQYEQLYQQMLT
ncbi:MAG: glycosyltransferase family 4 protein, partial [Anaerolineae bacterium]|nr:glycosyltransferase family 4 protein [Anaerolineae bacterium]